MHPQLTQNQAFLLMLYGTSREDVLPYANFSFETIWFTLHCPFLFLAIKAGDNVTA